MKVFGINLVVLVYKALNSLEPRCLIDDCHLVMTRAHSFPRAAEFRAEPRNLAVAAEFLYFHGISRNSE